MNINFLKLSLLSAIFFGVIDFSYAQPREDAHEISGGASFFRPIGSGSGAFNADAAYGYSISDPVQVGVRQSYTLTHSDDVPDVWNAVTAPFVNYYFLGDSFLGMNHSQTFVPYVGAFLGAVWNDDDFTGTTGPQLGVRTYLTESTFVGLNYRYEWFFEEVGDANETQDANHVATLGLGYTWGGAPNNQSNRHNQNNPNNQHYQGNQS